jgi:hypothetical protein
MFAGPDATPLFKQIVDVIFLAEPANLVDPTNVWWHDMTDYVGLNDSSWMGIGEADQKNVINDDTQVKIGQMRFRGTSRGERTYVWQPKSPSSEALIKVSRPVAR